MGSVSAGLFSSWWVDGDEEEVGEEVEEEQEEECRWKGNMEEDNVRASHCHYGVVWGNAMRRPSGL